MHCTPPQTLGIHTLTVRFTSMYTYPILSANGLPARSSIQLDPSCNPSCNRLNNTRLDTRCDSDHASQMNVLKKIPGFSLSDYVHSPRAQALPSNFNSSQPEGLIIRQNTHSLSQELLQQRVEPYIRRSGRSRSWLPTPCYRAIESSPFLLSDATCLLSTSSASYADRCFCSKKRPNFHSSYPTSLTSTHYPYLTIAPFFCRQNISYIRHQKSSPASVFLTTLPFYLVRSSFPIALASSSRFQTAILHKCSTILHHNSEPPYRLHAHSVSHHRSSTKVQPMQM